MVTEEELQMFVLIALKLIDSAGGGVHGELFEQAPDGTRLRTIHVDMHDAALCGDKSVEPIVSTLQ